MRRKASIIYLFIALTFVLTGISCHQYKLDNAVTDISRNWELVKYVLNGGDSTYYYEGFVTDYKITFTTEGYFTETYNFFGIPTTVGGSYNFQDNLQQLVLSDEDTTRVYDIIELKPQKLTIELVNTFDDEDIFYLEPY